MDSKDIEGGICMGGSGQKLSVGRKKVCFQRLYGKNPK